MPKDAKGNDIEVGDSIIVPCRVVRRYPKEVDIEPTIKDPHKPPFHFSMKRSQFTVTPVKGDTVSFSCTVAEILTPIDDQGDADFTADNLRVTPAIVDAEKPGQLLSLKSNQVIKGE